VQKLVAIFKLKILRQWSPHSGCRNRSGGCDMNAPGQEK
jgi:hypothetical protein